MSLIVVFVAVGITNAEIATFDDLSLETESYWNGSDGSGGFVSGSANFNNFYEHVWGSWAGFAYSNIKDTSAQSWASQYNAITGDAQSGDIYAAGYLDSFNQIAPIMALNSEQVLTGLYVTNSNYVYYSMLNGDAFAKKFGGASGDDPDWFLLTIIGKDASGNVTGVVEFYLADYRFADNSQDYIVDTWQYVDLTSLGVVKSLEFTLNSSDVGPWGMNTPAYFMLDTVISDFLILAVQNIEDAIASKVQAMEAVDEALAKERQAIEALKSLLSDGELDDLRPADLYKAELKIRLAMKQQRKAKRTISKSIDRLDDVLAILTGQAGQQNWSEENDIEKDENEAGETKR